MAKKSSKSKGYRRQAVKKPFLTKKETILLIIILAVLIVGAVLLFNYDDGALKVEDGQVVAGGDNWVIVDGSNVRGRARYFKLGEVAEIEGLTRASAPTLLDVNVPTYTYTPDAEDAEIDSISVTAYHNRAEALAQNYVALMKATEGYEVSEVQNGARGGLSYKYCTYTHAYTADEEAADAEAADEEAAETADETESAEPNRFAQAVNAYVDGAHDSAVIVTVVNETDSADAYLSDEAMLAWLEKALDALSLEAGK